MRMIAFCSIAALAFAGLARPVLAEEAPAAPAPKTEPTLESVYLALGGLDGAEVVAVAKALGATEGVREFAWIVEGTEAKVVREAGKASDDVLLGAAKTAGASAAERIPVAATKFVFAETLHCGGCVRAVNKALLAIKGVKESSVSDAMTDVTVVYDTRAVKPSDIEAALTAIERPAKAAAR